MWRVIRIFLILKIAFIHGKLSGDHVCLTEESFLVNVTQTYLKSVTVRNYQWCLNVPPRCSTYTIKNVPANRVVEKSNTRTVEACCPGFIEKENQCISSCLNCRNGICENGHCKCSSGYKGENCDLECSTGEWGPNCSKSCNCYNDKCDSKTGICLEQKPTTTSTTTTKIEPSTTQTPITTTKINEKTTNSIQAITTTEISNKQQVKDILSTTETTIPTTIKLVQTETTTNFVTETVTIKSEFSNLSISNISISKNITANSNLTFSNTPIATKEGLLIPVEIQYDEKQKPTTIRDKNYISVANEEYLNRESPNHFSSNDFVLFGITVLMALMLVATILSINFLRRKRRKNEIQTGNHQVSVFSANIFHSPLPEPPVTENPLYLNTINGKNNFKELSTFETRIVCNVNGSHSPVKDSREFEYDHPPSTGSYRAASLVDPLEIKKGSLHSIQDYVVEPLYDEIPQKENEQNGSIYSAPMSIYINTCGRTKF